MVVEVRVTATHSSRMGSGSDLARGGEPFHGNMVKSDAVRTYKRWSFFPVRGGVKVDGPLQDVVSLTNSRMVDDLRPVEPGAAPVVEST